eukprot:2416070-Heterocapsa_arctica.AAC.1
MTSWSWRDEGEGSTSQIASRLRGREGLRGNPTEVGGANRGPRAVGMRHGGRRALLSRARRDEALEKRLGSRPLPMTARSASGMVE